MRRQSWPNSKISVAYALANLWPFGQSDEPKTVLSYGYAAAIAATQLWSLFIILMATAFVLAVAKEEFGLVSLAIRVNFIIPIILFIILGI
jgi:hypothetical protein